MCHHLSFDKSYDLITVSSKMYCTENVYLFKTFFFYITRIVLLFEFLLQSRKDVNMKRHYCFLIINFHNVFPVLKMGVRILYSPATEFYIT